MRCQAAEERVLDRCLMRRDLVWGRRGQVLQVRDCLYVFVYTI
jgi:hypothetical protein